MTHAEEIARRLVSAVGHTMAGNGPASLRLTGKDYAQPGCVVFVIPAPLGIIIDDALDKIYTALGWTVSEEGKGQVN